METNNPDLFKALVDYWGSVPDGEKPSVKEWLWLARHATRLAVPELLQIMQRLHASLEMKNPARFPLPGGGPPEQ